MQNVIHISKRVLFFTFLVFCLIITIWDMSLKSSETSGLRDTKTSSTFSTVSTSSDWKTNIDFVIPWSGQTTRNVNGTDPPKEGTDPARERCNNELPYLLRSISRNAPWVRKIFIVVNSDAIPAEEEMNEMIPSNLKANTAVIDRCSYMPKGTCPTRNSHAVKAFLFLIPGLAEHFVIGDDDIFFGRPLTPEFFYDEGKPYVWRKAPPWGFFKMQEFHRIYEKARFHPSFPLPKSSAPSPHFWHPQLKSSCQALEKQFHEYFQFMSGHTEGRFWSMTRGPNDKHNSQEECYVGVSNWHLLRTGQGVYKNIDAKRGDLWDEVVISEEGFKKASHDRPIFMNVNDNFSNNETVYKQELEWFHAAMEEMYPQET